MTLTVNDALRALAGTLVVASVALGTFVHPGWFLLAAFVGLNLLQSAFSKWCPAMTVFRKAGLKESAPAKASCCGEEAA